MWPPRAAAGTSDAEGLIRGVVAPPAASTGGAGDAAARKRLLTVLCVRLFMFERPLFDKPLLSVLLAVAPCEKDAKENPPAEPEVDSGEDAG